MLRVRASSGADVNKRQRKKQLKKAMARAVRPLTPTQLHEIGDVIGDFIKAEMMRSSFVSQIIRPAPWYVAPFRKWRDLGKGQLTHHVGTSPYVDGHGCTGWLRICDVAVVDSMYILTNDEAVTCFGCLTKEHLLHAPTDL